MVSGFNVAQKNIISIWETQRWTVPRAPSPFPLLTQLLCTAPSQQAGAPAAAGSAHLAITQMGVCPLRTCPKPLLTLC